MRVENRFSHPPCGNLIDVLEPTYGGVCGGFFQRHIGDPALNRADFCGFDYGADC
jgi:hypothetical protein